MAVSGKLAAGSGAGALATASGVEGFRDDSGWHLSSPDFQLSISGKSGCLSNLKSRLPTELNISPLAGAGLQVSIENEGPVWSVYMDKMIKGKMKKEGDGISVTCSLSSHDEALAKAARAEVRYSLDREKLGVDVKIKFLWDDKTPHKITVGIECNPRGWDRHFYAMNYGDTRIYKMGEGITANYMDSLDDILQVEDRLAQPWGKDREGAYRADIALALPYGVMEREDRYVLWGCLDLGKFVVLVPNDRDMMPAFMMYPKEIRAGMEKEFDFFLKVFPKPENTFTEVLRWYAMNVESSDPLTKGIVTMSGDLKPRTLIHEGCIGYKSLWYAIKGRWYDETYPASGEWASWDNTASAEGEKATIEGLQKTGKHVYLYFRQLYPNIDLDNDTPPHNDWMVHNKYGSLVYWAGNPDFYALTPWQKEHWGIKAEGKVTTGHVFADFNNDEFRAWYVSKVKEAIDHYQPDGIAWDIGWGDLFTGASLGSPEHGGINHGILRMKHDIYVWLRQKYPDKRVITNCHFGTPDMLYCDAVMHESGIARGVSPELYRVEAEKDRAYKNIPISYQYKEPGGLLIDTALGYSSANLEGYSMYSVKNEKGRFSRFVEFAEKTYVTPLVSEANAIQAEPARDFRTMMASVWANNDRVLAAVFNGRGEDVELTIRFDKRILKEYGHLLEKDYTFTVVDSNACPTEVNNFVKAAPYTIKGTLKRNHMLMAEGEQ